MKSLAGCLIAYAAIAWVFASQGRPNVDEGIFLGAARLVAEGQLPYRDFPFSQAPLLPYAYAPAPSWQGSALLGGRLVSWLFGVGGMAAALWLALRAAGPRAVLFTLALALAALPNLWLANSVRAQSLATPLLLASAAALALPLRSVGQLVLAPSLLLWACGLRLTHGLALALVLAWLAWKLRREPRRIAQLAGILGAQGLVVFGPALCAPRDAFFHVITAQLERGARIGYIDTLPWAGELVRRAGVYADLLAEAWLPALAVALAAAGWLFAWWRGARLAPGRPVDDPHTAQLTLALLAAASFAPHLAFANAFPSYLMSFWALAAPAVGIAAAVFLERAARPALGIALALLVCGGVAFNAVQQWPRWIGRGAASVESFRRVGAELGARHGPDCVALTFETHLALEAGCRVLPGLEYSLFSYFPDLDADAARARGVLGLEGLRAAVEARPPDWIALAPAHPRILSGAKVERRGGHLLVPQVEPLDFLGPLAADYTYRERLQIPSGSRRPGKPATKPLWLYERR